MQANRQFFLFALVVFLFGFFWFFGVLNNWFVAEDLILLDFAKNSSFGLQDFFLTTPVADWAYRPFETMSFWLLFPFFGMNAFPYKLLGLLLYSVNCVLVFVLAKQLTKNNWLAFFSGLVFSTFFLNYEVVFYAETLHHLLMRFFMLFSVILFIEYRARGKKHIAAASALFFLLALFSEETAAVTLPIFFAFDFFVSKKLSLGRLGQLREKLFGDYLPAVLALAAYAALRVFAVSLKHGVAEQPNSLLLIATHYKNLLFFLFNPFPFLAETGKGLIGSGWIAMALLLLALAVFALVNFFVFFKNKNQALRFALSWVYLSLIIPSVFGSVQARYFFVPEIGASIFLALFFSEASIALGKKLRFSAGKIALVLCIAWLFVALPQSHTYVSFQDKQWESGGETVRNSMERLAELQPGFSGVKEAYFLGFPGSLRGKFSWDSALVFRNSQFAIVDLVYGAGQSEKTLVRTSLPQEGLQSVVSKKGTVVFAFDAKTGSIKKIVPSR